MIASLLLCVFSRSVRQPKSRFQPQIPDRLFLPVLVAEGRSPIHRLPHRLFFRFRLRFIHICYSITRQRHGPGAQAILRRSCGGGQETRAERVAGGNLASRAGHGDGSMTKVRGIGQRYRPKSCVRCVPFFPHNASAGYACGSRFQQMANWPLQGDTLRADVINIRQGFPVGDIPDRNFRNLKTTAVALIQYSYCSWGCVYAISGQTDPAPATEVQNRARELGYQLIRGAGRHAEERIINNLPKGTTLLAIAPCRPACSDETTNRVDASCTTDIQQQSQRQGFAVMLFNPVGGQNACL